MSDYVAGAAIGAGGSLLGSLASGLFNTINTESNNLTQMMLSKYSYEQQRKMIQEQNEYNSPLQQMKRYQEAGLNPNLIYGNGQSSAGNQSGIAQYHVPNTQAPYIDFGDLGASSALSNLIGLKSMEKELDIKDAQIQKILAEAGYLDSQARYYNLTHGDGLDSPAFLKDFSQEIQLKNQKIDLNEFAKTAAVLDNESKRWDIKQKKFWQNEIMPVYLSIQKAQLEGMSYDNIIKKIDSETEYMYRMSQSMSSPLRAASSLGVLFGSSDIGKAWKARIKELIKNPFKKKSGYR